MYVFKKGAFINTRSYITSPHFLREASPTKSCTTKELFAVFCKAFYYVANEKKHMEAVCDACELLNKHLIFLCKVANEKHNVIERLQLKLLTTIACYSTIRKARKKDILRCDTQLKGFWSCYNELITKTRKLTDAINGLKERLNFVNNCENLLNTTSEDVVELFAEYKGLTL